MRSYTAHLKPGRSPVLCREGWSWGAFVFGALWLLTEGAWIPAVLQIAVAVIVVAVAPAFTPGLLALAVLNGLAGRDLVRWSLARRGYALAHVVVAPDPDAAMLRLLTARPELVA